MRHLAIAYLIFVVVVAVVGTALAIGALPEALARFGREPEDFYGVIFWASFCAIVILYCADGILRGLNRRKRKLGFLGYIGSGIMVLFGVLLLFTALSSPTDHFLVVVAPLMIFSPVAYIWLGWERAATQPALKA